MATDCTCEKCRAECLRRPGWFTPGEALRAIAAGHSARLVIVEEHGQAPAVAPRGAQFQGFMGRCTFLSEDGRCEIHDSGFKPVECRLGFGCRLNVGISEKVVYSMWRTRLGQQAVAALKQAWAEITAQ